VKFHYVINMKDFSGALITESGEKITSEGGVVMEVESAPTELASVSVPARATHFVKAFNMLSRGKFKEVQYLATTSCGRLSLHAIKGSAFSDTINPER
jgi:hypothetical protein